MGWETRPCAVPGCALAFGHTGDHRTQAAIDRHERSALMWRVLIVVGLGVLAWLVLLELR